MATRTLSTRAFRRLMILGLCGTVAGSSLLNAGPGRVRHASLRTAAVHFVEPLATDSIRPGERAFLEKALAASRLETRLGELGVSQATNSDVRGHAQQVAAEHRLLTDAVDSVVRKKGIALSAPQHGPAERYAELAQKSGADFDRMFVRVMAQLHEETIALFEQATADSKDSDIRELASAQLPMLREHLNRITELRKQYD